MLSPTLKWKLLAFISILAFVALAFKEKYPKRIKAVISRTFLDGKPEDLSFQTNSYYLEQTDYQTIFKGKRKIVMLGNSLTFRMHWDELLDRPDVANRGIGSDVIKGFYHRLDNVIALEPRICFIEGGANDIDFGVSMDTSFYYLGKIVDSLKVVDIIPVASYVIYVTNYYPGADKFNQQARLFNEKINQMAEEKNIDVIDLNPELAPSGYLDDGFAQSDGIHLKSMAYSIWRNKVRDILRKHRI
jgi:lysophospholipase L1-like esterase